jgi:cytochrome P450
VINAADGDLHRRERSVVAKAFTPRRIRRFEASITAWCEELTDHVLGRNGVPFVEEFAIPLPTKVIAQGLGLAPDDYRDLKRWSDGFQAPIGDTSPETLEAFVVAAVEFTAYIAPIIEQRRRQPADDLISVVVGANDAGERLSTEDALAMCMVLLLGGNETVTASLAGALLYLVRAPDLQAQLRAEPALIPTFIEEALRLVTPPQMMFRTATRDTELGGARIGAGDHLLLRPGAANRDAAQFPEPLVPSLRRPDKRHLSFGRGVHVCPGAPLARAELRIALETLLARTSAITLAERDDAIVPAGNPMTASVGEIHLDVHA